MALFTNLAMFLYAFMDCALKDGYTNQKGTLVDFGVVRSFVMLPFAFFLLKYHGKPYFADIQPWQWKFLIIRNVIGCFAIYICSISLMTISITEFNILINLSPFFTVVLCYFWLGESMTACDIVAMCFCFGGVVLVALADPAPDQPTGAMFSGLSENGRQTVGICAALSMSVAFSVWMVMVRKLKDLHYSVIFFTGMVFDACFISVCFTVKLLYCWLSAAEPETWPFQFTTTGFLEFVASGTVNCAAQNLTILAGMYSNPAVVQLVAYGKILYVYLADKIIFKTSFTGL
jgi:drug/metabolite transporter (DMT)-like permease